MNISISIYEISDELKECLTSLLLQGFDVTFRGVSKTDADFNSVFSFSANEFSFTIEVPKKKFEGGILYTKRVNIPYDDILSYQVFFSCYEDKDKYVSEPVKKG